MTRSGISRFLFGNSERNTPWPSVIGSRRRRKQKTPHPSQNSPTSTESATGSEASTILYTSSEDSERGMKYIESGEAYDSDKEVCAIMGSLIRPEPIRKGHKHQNRVLGDKISCQSCIDLNMSSLEHESAKSNHTSDDDTASTSTGTTQRSRQSYRRQQMEAATQGSEYSDFHTEDYMPPNTIRHNEASAFVPVMKSTPEMSDQSRLMVLGENNTFSSVPRNQDIKKILAEITSMNSYTDNTSHFKAALQRLCSIPLDLTNHFSIMGEFNTFLAEKKVLTDVRVKIGKKVYLTHRVMLACFSSYFQQILYHQTGPVTLPIDIKLRDVKQESFRTYISFIYSGRLDLTGDNIADMLLLSDQLGIPYLRLKCIEYDDEMSITQALSILKRSLPPKIALVEHAFQTVLQNCKSLGHYSDFLCLDIDTICSILSHKNIVISSEVDVFRLGMQWVMHRTAERHAHAIRVMYCVRFSQMTQSEIFQCASMADMLRDNMNFRTMIITAYWASMCREKNNDPFACYIPPLRTCFQTQHAEDTSHKRHIPVNGLHSNNMPKHSSFEQHDQPHHEPDLHKQLLKHSNNGCQTGTSLAAMHDMEHTMGSLQRTPSDLRTQAFKIKQENSLVAEQGSQLPTRQIVPEVTQGMQQFHPQQRISNSPLSRESSVQDLKPSFHQSRSRSPLSSDSAVQDTKLSHQQSSMSGSCLNKDNTVQDVTLPSQEFHMYRVETITDDVEESEHGSSARAQSSNFSGIQSASSTGRVQSNLLKSTSGNNSECTVVSDESGASDSDVSSGSTATEESVLNASKKGKSKQKLPSYCGSSDSANASDIGSSSKPLPPGIGDILAIGGFQKSSKKKKDADVKASTSMELFDSHEKKWKHFTDLPHPTINYAVCIMEGTVYLSGGVNAKKKKDPPTKKAYCFSCKTKQWETISNMNTARRNHSMVKCQGQVYAIGGIGINNKVLDSVECYNPSADMWEYVEAMPTARFNMAAGPCDGKIFVVGGEGEIGPQKKFGYPVLKNVEVFDPANQCWETRNGLREPRSCASLAVVDKIPFLVGGLTRPYQKKAKNVLMGEMDIYRQSNDTWLRISNMKVPVQNPGVAVIGPKIHVYGGQTEDNKNVKAAYTYHSCQSVWEECKYKLPYPAKWLHCLLMPSRKR
ncbi:hypothetical protein ScPMuIL_009652 [Solemya velum]